MVTACSDIDVTDELPNTPDMGTDSIPVPLMVNTYYGKTSKTRAVTTLTDLETNGFGVYAYYDPFGHYEHTWTDRHDYVSTPNFMFNTKMDKPSTNWQYSPIKYWPNEDAENSWYDWYESADPASIDYYGDRRTNTLSFFAYAPYVAYFDDSEGAHENVVNEKKEFVGTDGSMDYWVKNFETGKTTASSGIVNLPTSAPTKLMNSTNDFGYFVHFDYLLPSRYQTYYTDYPTYDCDPILTYMLNDDWTASTDLLVGVVAADNTIKSYTGKTRTINVREVPYTRKYWGYDGEGVWREITETGTETVRDTIYTSNKTNPTPGTSYLNMTKPALGTNLKFQFFHALSALRIQVRADWVDDDNTRITLGKVSVGTDGTPLFYKEGRLNLRTVTPYTPNWVGMVGEKTKLDLTSLIYDNVSDGLKDRGAGATQPEGVRSEPKNLLTGKPSADEDQLIYLIPVRNITGEGVAETYDGTVDMPIEIEYYATTTDGANSDNSARWHAKSTRSVCLKLLPGKITTLTIVLSMDDVTFDASIDEWPMGYEGTGEIDLPENK